MANLMAVRWCRLYRGTPAELALEDAVAALGVPYRTQFPGFLYGVRFFVDFYLPTLKLVIEVDDPSHEQPDKKLADAERTAQLEDEWGVQVLRCSNDDALTDPRGTVARLMRQARYQPGAIRSTPMASALPEPKSAPAKERRASKMAERRARRRKARNG